MDGNGKVNYTKEDVSEMIDELIEIVKVCLTNKEKWLNDKKSLYPIIREKYPKLYYERYKLVNNVVEETNIEPLLAMLKAFYNVQTGKVDALEMANSMTDIINKTYAGNILSGNKK